MESWKLKLKVENLGLKIARDQKKRLHDFQDMHEHRNPKISPYRGEENKIQATSKNYQNYDAGVISTRANKPAWHRPNRDRISRPPLKSAPKRFSEDF